MKRNYLILLFLCLLSVNCTTTGAPETNQPTATNSGSAANANVAAENLKKLPEAVPVFTDASEASATGDKYLDAGSTENAINAFRQAVKINPDFAEAYFKLGIAYSLFEKESTVPEEPDEELAPVKKGKKDTPKLTNAEKAFENAAKVYEKILKKNPQDAQAHFNLGRAYNKLNKDKEAEKSLRLAVKLKPDDVEFLTELGAILMKLAQYDEAVTVLNKAVKLDDTNLQAQDLLEKAAAGKKRINFGVKPKSQAPESSPQKRERVKPKPNATTAPAADSKPAPKPEPTR